MPPAPSSFNDPIPVPAGVGIAWQSGMHRKTYFDEDLASVSQTRLFAEEVLFDIGYLTAKTRTGQDSSAPCLSTAVNV